MPICLAAIDNMLLLTEIIERVKKPESPPLRPQTQSNPEEVHPAAVTLMVQCWHESAELRPDFSEIKKTLRSFNKGK